MSEALPLPASSYSDHRRRGWMRAVLLVGLAMALAAPFFAHDIAGAVRVWTDSRTYNHCFLILPIVIYLIWERRGQLQDVVPRPSPWGLVAVGALSVLWLSAATLDVQEARQFMVIGIVQALLLTLLGGTAYRRLMGPFLYLFFLVPSGEFLVPTLQDLTARLAVAGLHLVGVPVFSDGTFIDIPEGNFVVAEACAGLRFLIASIAYGVLFGLLVYNSWTRRIIFVALSVLVPIAANAVRVFGIIFGAHVIGSAQAAEADHILYGWIFFSIVIFLLTLIGMSFAERSPAQKPPTGTSESAAASPRPSRGAQGAILVAAILLAALGPAYALLTDGSRSPNSLTDRDLPLPGDPWHSVQDRTDWQPLTVGADREFVDSFRDDRSEVERYVALYVTHGTHNNVVRGVNRIADGTKWKRVNSGTASVKIGGRDYPVAVTEIRSDAGSRLVWSFYVIDGNVVSGGIRAKLHQAYAELLGRGRVAAFVALSTPVLDSIDPSSRLLGRFLEHMPAFDHYVAQIR